VIEKVLAEDNSRLDFGKEVIPNSLKNYNVQAYLFNGYWEDIGTIAAFYKANLDMTSAIPPFNLFDAEAPLFTRARYLPPSKIDNCEIRDSIISEGCIVNGAKIYRSVIGLRSRLGEGAQIDAGGVAEQHDHQRCLGQCAHQVLVGLEVQPPEPLRAKEEPRTDEHDGRGDRRPLQTT
jgi:ADP-glucose pyrophosphorylase